MPKKEGGKYIPIAPAAKAGMATKSSLGRGYGVAKKSLYASSDLQAACSAKLPLVDFPGGVYTVTKTPVWGVRCDTASNSPTKKAKRLCWTEKLNAGRDVSADQKSRI